MSKDDINSPSLNVISSISPTDDDLSLTTTSTESETFETWTLITDKQKAKASPNQQQLSLNEPTKPTTTRDLCSHVETLRNETPDIATEEESNSENIAELTKEADDFSDGISIISESSESIGRMSPHPLLREHLHSTLPSLLKETATYKDAVDAMETDDDVEVLKEIKRRKRSMSHQALQPAQEIPANNLMSLIIHLGNKPIVKEGVSAIFYAGVAIALFALLGQLRYSEYSIVNGQSLETFQQKINELELQNNLMSAEIDLLNKQVNYLTDIYEKSRGYGENAKDDGERKSGKTFKAWSGNGNKMDAVHIKKEDLRRPYKCGIDGKFVEIGGMCVEVNRNADEMASIIDEVGSAVNDVLQDKETYKSFEKVAEAFLKSSNDDEVVMAPTSVPEPPIAHENVKNDREFVQPMPNYQKNHADNSKEYRKNSKKPYRKTQKKYDDSGEHDDDDKDSHEHSSHEERRKRAYNSKERHQQDSRERSEYKNKKPRKSYGSGERENKAGANKDAQWHENLMLQREELRRQRQKNNEHENWYIERGDSREQARSS